MNPTRASLTLLLTAGLALTGCAQSDGGATPRPPASTAAGDQQSESLPATAGEVPTVPAEAGHLHGLGVDPHDGKLYLGTHAGLMIVEEDAVSRVGTATIDLMGFAIAGPQHYYASGHPGPGDDLPDPVGLIETTDGGQSWKPLSLTGESDFHTLTAGTGRVYGYDGRIKATADGRAWTDGAQDVRPASLSVHPERPDTVLATTEHGPVRSADGGESFTHLEGAPLLVFLAWTSPATLWGVAPDGTVHRSADSGATWQEAGTAGGPPEAFTADGDSTVVVATAEGIVRSDDAGMTFTTIAHKG